MDWMLAGLSTRRYPVGLAGRRPHRAERHQHVPLGGVAAVRRTDRGRAGRAAGRAGRTLGGPGPYLPRSWTEDRDRCRDAGRI